MVQLFFLYWYAISPGESCGDVFSTVKDAINEWCTKMNIEQGERTDAEMLEHISEYEYDDLDTYFYINEFTFGWW